VQISWLLSKVLSVENGTQLEEPSSSLRRMSGSTIGTLSLIKTIPSS